MFTKDILWVLAIILHTHTVNCTLNISDVTTLVFKKPISYDYRSGQWIRIAAKGLNVNEYHPFTLTSAPHEEYLSLHIRAVGPWTYLLRDLYNPDNLDEKTGYPSVSLHAWILCPVWKVCWGHLVIGLSIHLSVCLSVSLHVIPSH